MNLLDIYNTSSYGLDGLLIVWKIFLVIMGFVLVAAVLTLIGQWKLFKKAGQDGWKAIIPIYNTYILCQITGVNPWWILIVFGCGFIGGIFPVLSFVASIASLYFNVLLAISTARSFGKDDSYAIGLILLSPVFYLILGCGESSYVGAKPMNDVILNAIMKQTGNTSSQGNGVTNGGFSSNSTTTSPTEVLSDSSVSDTKQNGTIQFCSQCGTRISEHDRFCPNCGREI